jgi:hypothetical protein
MKLTQVASQYSKGIGEVKATIEVWIMCKGAFPPHIPRKQRCPSALQTMNCTPADNRLQKSVGQTTDRNRARLPSLFGMKFTQVPSQCSKGIGEVKATIKVWLRAKAPSCHVSRESSAALRLFKQ